MQQIQASGHAFAAVLSDGSVVTWGDADFGGDSSQVQEQLKDVQQIQSSRRSGCVNCCSNRGLRRSGNLRVSEDFQSFEERHYSSSTDSKMTYRSLNNSMDTQWTLIVLLVQQ